MSFHLGAFFVAGISALIALLSGKIENMFFRWAAALLLPLTVAYLLYWVPVWLASSDSNLSRSEFSNWAFVCIVPWFLFGALASTAVVIGVRQHLKAKDRRNA